MAVKSADLQPEQESQPATDARQKRRWHHSLNSGDVSSLRWEYDADLDAFAVYVKDPPPTVTIHCDDDEIDSALMVSLETDEVVGVEVYGWERAFLASHPELDVAWRMTRNPVRRTFASRPVSDVLGGLARTTAALVEQACGRVSWAT